MIAVKRNMSDVTFFTRENKNEFKYDEHTGDLEKGKHFKSFP